MGTKKLPIQAQFNKYWARYEFSVAAPIACLMVPVSAFQASSAASPDPICNVTACSLPPSSTFKDSSNYFGPNQII